MKSLRFLGCFIFARASRIEIPDFLIFVKRSNGLSFAVGPSLGKGYIFPPVSFLVNIKDCVFGLFVEKCYLDMSTETKQQ